MKKITLLLVCVSISNALFAQVQTYTDLSVFQTAYTASLNSEDFSSGPSDPAICGTVVSSVANDCFSAGTLIEGFEITESQNSDIVYLPEGFLPSNNPTPRLGANSGANFTIVSFTGSEAVYAVGVSLHIDNNSNFNFRVYDDTNTLIYNETEAFTSFYGVISSAPISKIEVEGAEGVGELLGDLKFGTENVLSVNEVHETNVTYFPNPVKNILYFSAQAAVTSIVIYNMTGQKLGDFQTNSNSIDMQHLGTGMYMLSVIFQNGQTKTLKILKE